MLQIKIVDPTFFCSFLLYRIFSYLVLNKKASQHLSREALSIWYYYKTPDAYCRYRGHLFFKVTMLKT